MERVIRDVFAMYVTNSWSIISSRVALSGSDHYGRSRINSVHETLAQSMISLPYVPAWHSLSLIWDNDGCKPQLMLQTRPKDGVEVRGVREERKRWYSTCYSRESPSHADMPWNQYQARAIRGSNQQPYGEQGELEGGAASPHIAVFTHSKTLSQRPFKI